MNLEEQILSELKLIKMRLDQIQLTRLMKIPEAAKYLRISPAKLRELCKSGLPCTKVSDKSQPQYLIDISIAKEYLMRSHHLISDKTTKRHRKSVINLNV